MSNNNETMVVNTLKGRTSSNSISLNGLLRLSWLLGILEIKNQANNALAKLRAATPENEEDSTLVATVGYVVNKVDSAVNAALGSVNIATLQSDVANLQSGMMGLNTTVTGIQTDVSNLQSGMMGLNTTVTGIQTDVGNLQTDVAALQSGGGSTAAGTVLSSTADVGTSTAESPNVIPTGKRLLQVFVDVTEAYDNGTTLKVGFGGTIDALLDEQDVDLTTVGFSAITVPYTTTGADKLKATITGATANGACTVTATWIY